jgi:hypothetical protein
VPERLAVTGDPLAPVNVIVAVPLSIVPGVADGVNLTVTVQDVPVASVDPQVVDSVLQLVVYDGVIAEIRLPLELVSVSACPELAEPCGTRPKEREDGASETVPGLPLVTLSADVSGDPVKPVKVTCNVAVSRVLGAAVGVVVSVIVQELPFVSVDPQVVPVTVKSVEYMLAGIEFARLEIVLPLVLLTVTFMLELVVP